jgi:multiple sugar transport system ATP-binding protein
MASIAFQNLRKAFAGVPVIRDVDFSINDGEFAVLVGPSGCGKSTLLRMLAGLEEVTSGQIAIDGRVINGVDSKDRDIAMVFQSYALYPHMSVEENMGFSLKMREQKPSVIAERVASASKILGLDLLLKRYPRELSGGQRQRVAMGRAIVRDPKVFLFDEPLSNLDAKLRVAMRAEIKALHQRLRTTTVYVTHDQVEAMTMADRIVVLNAGRVEQVGAPLELYDHPANLFVAEFIGAPTMNIVQGRLVRREGFFAVQAADGVEWLLPRDVAAPDGLAVAYGIRPEHLQIVDAATPGAMGAEVLVVEPTGAMTEIVANLGSMTLTLSAPGRPGVSPGEHIHIAVQGDHAHLFDAASGARLVAR